MFRGPTYCEARVSANARGTTPQLYQPTTWGAKAASSEVEEVLIDDPGDHPRANPQALGGVEGGRSIDSPSERAHEAGCTGCRREILQPSAPQGRKEAHVNVQPLLPVAQAALLLLGLQGPQGGRRSPNVIHVLQVADDRERMGGGTRVVHSLTRFVRKSRHSTGAPRT